MLLLACSYAAPRLLLSRLMVQVRSWLETGCQMAGWRMVCCKEALEALEEFGDLGVVMEAVHQIVNDRYIVERTDILTIEHSP